MKFEFESIIKLSLAKAQMKMKVNFVKGKLHRFLGNLEEFTKEYLDDIILVVGAILISLFSFAMGYLLAKQQGKEPIKFEQSKNVYSSSSSSYEKLDI